MEISSATQAARETTINKTGTGRDILQRAQQENEEAARTQQEEITAEARKVEPGKQGRIDLYA